MNKQLIRKIANVTDRMWKKRACKGLLFGDIGISLVHNSLYKITEQQLHKHRIEAGLSQYMPEHFSESNLFTFFPINYAYGLVGVYSAYNIIYFNSNQRETDLLDLSEFYEFICENMSDIDLESNFGFFHGAAGQLQYLNTDPGIDKKQISVLLEDFINIMEVSSLKQRFSISSGQVNVTVSHGITGLLLVILNCCNLHKVKPDNLQSILSEGIGILNPYLEQRMEESDRIPFQLCDFKRDLMVCLFLLKANDKIDTTITNTTAYNYCKFILDKVELELPENFAIGQTTGLSGILECVRSIFSLVQQKDIKDWFEYHHDRLCNFLLKNTTYEYTMNNTFYDGISGTLLTALSPEIEDDPNWRKLLLY